MSRKRNYRVEIASTAIFLFLEILFIYFELTGVMQPFQTIIYGNAVLSGFIVVITMARITAQQSILKRHQISITIVLLIAAVLLASVALIAVSAGSITGYDSIVLNFGYFIIFVIFDAFVIILVKIVDWRAERVQKPNQSLTSKIWEK